MNWDRKLRALLVALDGETGAFLHRLLVRLGETDEGRAAIEALSAAAWAQQ